jgi:hypothetical protein
MNKRPRYSPPKTMPMPRRVAAFGAEAAAELLRLEIEKARLNCEIEGLSARLNRATEALDATQQRIRWLHEALAIETRVTVTVAAPVAGGARAMQTALKAFAGTR